MAIASSQVTQSRRGSCGKKISVTECDRQRFERLFPASAGDSDAHIVYFNELKDDEERLKFFHHLTVLQLRKPEKLSDDILQDAKRIDSDYVNLCSSMAERRQGSPRGRCRVTR